MSTQSLATQARPTLSVLNLKSLPFYLSHAAVLLVFVVPFSWSMVALAAALYAVRMFGITGGYHRYFSHRTYRTSRAFQFVMALVGAASMQKGPLWWAAHHRHHHRHSDQEGDLHSPGRQGFFWAHVGWILSTQHEETELQRVPDLAKYPELMWLDQWHAVPGVVLAVALYLWGGTPALVWGFFVSTVCCWHCTFMINSLTHMFGRRRYETKDDSRNSFLLAILTLGEGWHNNHHYWQSSTRNGFLWWEFDPTYYTLRALALFGIVWDLKEPPKHVVEGNKGRAAA
jgi:stearoyl-CoA desaturase (delta-9 desaturase)